MLMSKNRNGSRNLGISLAYREHRRTKANEPCYFKAISSRSSFRTIRDNPARTKTIKQLTQFGRGYGDRYGSQSKRGRYRFTVPAELSADAAGVFGWLAPSFGRPSEPARQLGVNAGPTT